MKVYIHLEALAPCKIYPRCYVSWFAVFFYKFSYISQTFIYILIIIKIKPYSIKYSRVVISFTFYIFKVIKNVNTGITITFTVILIYLLFDFFFTSAASDSCWCSKFSEIHSFNSFQLSKAVPTDSNTSIFCAQSVGMAIISHPSH